MVRIRDDTITISRGYGKIVISCEEIENKQVEILIEDFDGGTTVPVTRKKWAEIKKIVDRLFDEMVD